MKIEIKQTKQSAGLFLVATPIGNLGDISIRALEILHNADVIYCEDTRQTKKLLQAYDIKTKTSAYHDHSSEAVRKKIIYQIKEEGKSVALVSDAGMPLISDPGYKLVKDILAEDIPVTSIPGANAVLTALQLSGLPSDGFTFLGFLPPKQGARKTYLQQWEKSPVTLIFYEAKQRIIKTLQDVYDVYGDRQVAIARELTKAFEEVLRGTVTEVMEVLNAKSEIKGEFVLLIEPGKISEISEEDIKNLIITALKDNIPVKELSENIAQHCGRSKKEIYNLALKLKSE